MTDELASENEVIFENGNAVSDESSNAESDADQGLQAEDEVQTEEQTEEQASDPGEIAVAEFKKSLRTDRKSVV